MTKMLSRCALLAILAFLGTGCGVTSLQKEVNWYKQQLAASESDRNRLELELASCEAEQGGWADRTGTLREELERTKAELAEARRTPPLESVEIRPATTPATGDPADFQGIEGVRAERGEDDEIRITLDQQILFDPGSTAIRKSGQETLRRISDVLAQKYFQNEIRVEGHTDNTPPTRIKARYPTNWELSTARACVVLRSLIDARAAEPGRAAAVGYGDTRPVADNATDDGRRQNRRVEVVVVGR